MCLSWAVHVTIRWICDRVALRVLPTCLAGGLPCLPLMVKRTTAECLWKALSQSVPGGPWLPSQMPDSTVVRFLISTKPAGHHCISAHCLVCVKVRVRVETSPVLFGRLFCLQIGVVSARNLKCFEPPLLDTSCEDGRWICFGSRRGSLEQEGVQPTSSCCCKFWAKRVCHIVVCPMLATHSPPLSCACEGLSPPALLRIRIGMRHLLSARAVPSSFRAPTAERFSRRHGTATHFDHVFAGPRL